MMGISEQALETLSEKAVPLSEQLVGIVEGELVSMISLGVCAGFIMGTLFALAAYGIFKAISLLSIKKYN